jgi:urease accessory protein
MQLAQLRLQILFDSQFPTGAFAHSFGLETYAGIGLDADGFARLLEADLRSGWGCLDLAAFTMAWEACPDLERLDELGERLAAWKPLPSQRTASLRIGRSLWRTARRLFPAEISFSLPQPFEALSAGAASRLLGASVGDALPLYAQAKLFQQATTAARSMPISLEQGLEVVSALGEAVLQQCESVARDPEGSFYSFQPAFEIRRWQQGGLHTRLFQT